MEIRRRLVVCSGLEKGDEREIKAKLVELGADVAMKSPDDLFPGKTELLIVGRLTGNDKVQAAIALGIPILDAQYVRNSYNNEKRWIPEYEYFDRGNPRFEALNLQQSKSFISPLSVRGNIKNNGGYFKDMVAVVVLNDNRKKMVVNNLISLGGGKIYQWTAKHLRDSTTEQISRLNHVFSEPEMMSNDDFYTFMVANAAVYKLPLLSHNYLSHRLLKQTVISIKQFSILDAGIIAFDRQFRQDPSHQHHQALLNAANEFTLAHPDARVFQPIQRIKEDVEVHFDNFIPALPQTLRGDSANQYDPEPVLTNQQARRRQGSANQNAGPVSTNHNAGLFSANQNPATGPNFANQNVGIVSADRNIRPASVNQNVAGQVIEHQNFNQYPPSPMFSPSTGSPSDPCSPTDPFQPDSPVYYPFSTADTGSQRRDCSSLSLEIPSPPCCSPLKNSNPAPLSKNISQAPPSKNSNPAHPSKNIGQAPPSKNINTAPPSKNINTAPPSKNSNPAPPSKNSNPTPPSKNINQALPSKNASPSSFNNSNPAPPLRNVYPLHPFQNYNQPPVNNANLEPLGPRRRPKSGWRPTLLQPADDVEIVELGEADSGADCLDDEDDIQILCHTDESPLIVEKKRKAQEKDARSKRQKNQGNQEDINQLFNTTPDPSDAPSHPGQSIELPGQLAERPGQLAERPGLLPGSGLLGASSYRPGPSTDLSILALDHLNSGQSSASGRPNSASGRPNSASGRPNSASGRPNSASGHQSTPFALPDFRTPEPFWILPDVTKASLDDAKNKENTKEVVKVIYLTDSVKPKAGHLKEPWEAVTDIWFKGDDPVMCCRSDRVARLTEKWMRVEYKKFHDEK